MSRILVLLLILVLSPLAGGCCQVQYVTEPGDASAGPIRVERFEQLPPHAIGKLRDAVAMANDILSEIHVTEALRDRDIDHWDHAADPLPLRDDDGRRVAGRLIQPRRLVIRGWCPRRHWWIADTFEAFTDHHRPFIHVNTSRLDELDVHDWAEVIAHEYCHIVGYRHAGNCAAGNERTVPYRIGTLVGRLARQRDHAAPPSHREANAAAEKR